MGQGSGILQNEAIPVRRREPLQNEPAGGCGATRTPHYNTNPLPVARGSVPEVTKRTRHRIGPADATYKTNRIAAGGGQRRFYKTNPAPTNRTILGVETADFGAATAVQNEPGLFCHRASRFTKRTPSPATGQNDITKRTRGRDRNEILLFAASEPERNASFPDLAFRRINFRRLMADAKPKRSARFSIVGAGLGRKSLILLIEIPVTAFLK